MEFDEAGNVDGVPIRTPRDQSYRSCAQCGADCQPEPTSVEGLGVRVAFICAEHGVNALIDPFEGER